MNKKLKILFFVLAIPVGIFLFVFGEYDDSPGGQLLGLVMVGIGVVGLIRNKKNSSKKPLDI